MNPPTATIHIAKSLKAYRTSQNLSAAYVSFHGNVTPELLPNKVAVDIQSLTRHENSFLFELVSNTQGSPCPVCNELSSKIHSYYPRNLQDLPWAGYVVRINWNADK